MRKIPFMILAVSLAAPAWSETSSSKKEDLYNVYKEFANVNPFRLRPPQVEPPPQPEPAPEPVEVNVNLTGISMRQNVKRVHLMIPPTKEKPDPQYLTLEENDRQGSIEVLSIDPEQETVRVRNAGKLAVLSFASHGLSAGSPKKSSRSSSNRSNRKTASKGGSNNQSNNQGGGGPIVIGGNRNAGDDNGNNSNSGGSSSVYTPQTSLSYHQQNNGNGRSSNVRQTSSGSSSRFRRIRSRNEDSSSRNVSGNSESRTGSSQQKHNFQGSGEDIAAQQIISLKAQQMANPDKVFPPIPGMPQNNNQGGGGDGGGN